MSLQKKLKVAWVGTGVMGASMCKFLLSKPESYQVSVYNRTKAKADELISLGATWTSLEDLKAPNSYDVLVVMVLGPPEVEDLLITNNVLAALPEGALVIDHTSSSPGLAMRVAQLAAARKILCVDAPVSGGDVGAKNGTLAIMGGGSQDAYDRAKPIMDHYSKTVSLMGPAGAGHHTKIANQIMVASNIAAFCESLMYARKANLDLDLWYEIIKSGGGTSFIVEWLGPRILARDFKNGGAAKNMVKDLEMGLDECRRMGIALPYAATVHQFLRSLMTAGDQDIAVQGLVKVYEKWNGIKES
jgi:3-hydroxyisobutyrate dehydrogenase